MTSTPLAFPAASTSRRRVLLIEDDESIRDAFQDLLEYEGYDLAATADGHAALELLASGVRPDVILLDMMMPLMDGATFLRHLHARPETADLPVIVVSATQAEQPAGVLAFLRKPFEPDALLDILTQLFA